MMVSVRWGISFAILHEMDDELPWHGAKSQPRCDGVRHT